ncbi:lipase secretion chaperone [Aliiglaciecola sp. M165]|uniref:lipase secretion chaperone n=1 Tax=Aliiglaciecola sp. M165 TaxID=2593649 RepID=UPI00117EB10E|nr:lipase secretion chaperone [Aliiglaciecola sp. M165]TRY31543.1 lipase chaperone [Aliiglaciecola sp. M165]
MNKAVIILSSVCSVSAATLAYVLYSNDPQPASDHISKSVSVAKQDAFNLKVKTDLSVLPAIVQKGKNFVLFEGIKDVFDALILDAESQAKDALLALANQYCLSEKLNAQGCEQFVALFERYVDYKLALSEVEAQTVNYSSAVAEIEYRLAQINDLKYQFFSENEIHVLFGLEQKIESNALARYKIAKDSTLSQAQKSALLQHHFDSMPESEKQAFEPSLQLKSLHRIKQMPTSNQHKLALVRAQFGDQAASRLEASWDKQALFKARVEQLKEVYEKVPNDNQQAWLEQHFSTNQAKRARVLLGQ